MNKLQQRPLNISAKASQRLCELSVIWYGMSSVSRVWNSSMECKSEGLMNDE